MRNLTTTLHLHLKGKWYDMIDKGKKRVEYRRRCDYWNSRLLAIDENERIVYRHYDTVVLHYGFTKRSMEWTVEKIDTGYGDAALGVDAVDPKHKVYRIHLGKRIR